MKRSTERILTTHGGSLPRPPELQALIKPMQDGQEYDAKALDHEVHNAVADAVRKQADAGIDIPSDGEQGKAGFLLYGNQRMSGFEQVAIQPGESPRTVRRDQAAFSPVALVRLRLGMGRAPLWNQNGAGWAGFIGRR